MSQSFLARCCALIPLLLAACANDPYAHTYTRQKPELADLVGLYRLAHENLDLELDPVLRTEATGPSGRSSLTLQPHGTFLAVDFPAWTETDEGRHELESFDTFTGSWSLATVGSVGDGETATPVWGVRFDADGRAALSANLAGESAPYTLHFGYGDPDAGDAMQYQSDASPPETGEPDFTVVSAFFLLLFAAAAAVALGIAIVVVGCVLLALAAAALVIAMVFVACALLAVAVPAAIVCGAVVLAVVALAYTTRRSARAARRDGDERTGRPPPG